MYDAKRYPSLAALDEKVRLFLLKPEVATWETPRIEYEICRLHPVYWMEEYGYIKAGEMEGGSDQVGIIRFKLNDVQLQVADRICSHFVPEKWTRVQTLVLKHRKAGISTLIAALDYWHMRFIRDSTTFVIADLGGHTDNIAAMVTLFWERDLCGQGSKDPRTWPLQRVPMPKNKKGLKLSNGSMMEMDSGENANPGTSGTINCCHMSENSKWRDPLSAETSLLNSIPRKGYAFIVKESTAYGLNKFAQDCELAERGKSNWEFIFISWRDMIDCRKELLPGEKLSLTQEENELVATYSLSDEQIKFRRSQIELLGSIQQFKQDFPLNSREPFLISGANYFDTSRVKARMDEVKFYAEWKQDGLDEALVRFPELAAKIKYHPAGLREALSRIEDRCVAPMPVALSGSDGITTYTRLPSLGSDDGSGVMFRPPSSHRRYLVSVDVAEGIRSSEYTSDLSVIEVFDTMRREQVFEWAGIYDEEITAHYAVLLGNLYGRATIVVEMNNKCGATLWAYLEKSGYSRLFYREKVSSQQTKREPGWYTSAGNKKEVCATLKLDFKNEDCVIHSLNLLEEMFFFLDDHGKLAAASGKTDDRIMAASVNLTVISLSPELRQPINRVGPRFLPDKAGWETPYMDKPTPMTRRFP